MEIGIDEFVPVDVFHQVGDGLQREKCRLEKLCGDIAIGIHELIDIEVTGIGP